MEGKSHWKDFFKAWPLALERKGVLVTNFGEQIPFDSFMPSDTMLLIDRSVPDTTGARKIVLPYETISAVKFTNVFKSKLFLPLGFEEPPPKRDSN